MLTKVKVEWKHIFGGQRRSACWCPVALAIQEQLKPVCVTYPHVKVGQTKYRFGAVDDDFLLPDQVREFVAAFDGFVSVTPFEFELDVPDTMLRKEILNARHSPNTQLSRRA